MSKSKTTLQDIVADSKKSNSLKLLDFAAFEFPSEKQNLRVAFTYAGNRYDCLTEVLPDTKKITLWRHFGMIPFTAESWVARGSVLTELSKQRFEPEVFLRLTSKNMIVAEIAGSLEESLTPLSMLYGMINLVLRMNRVDFKDLEKNLPKE